MRTDLKERDGNQVKVEVEVTPEEIKEAFDAKLRELVREVRIPGFRPGKAPANMVRQRMGDEAVLADAIESGMNLWFAQAMYDLDLEAVDRPEVDMPDEMPSMEKSLTFTVAVMVMPEVELGEYKGLKVPKASTEVTSEELDERVEGLRNEFAQLTPVSGRAAKEGDHVIADFEAKLDGEPINELEATDYLFELGAGMIFSEVEEKVTGMKAGEKDEVKLTFAEDIPDENLKGKTVDFSIELKEIKEKVLPEVSDKWVSEVSEFATLLEFRQDVRKRLESAKTHNADQDYRAAAVGKAVENVKIDIPEAVVQREAAEMLAEFKSSLESRGVSLDDYLAATGMPFEKIVEDMAPRAAENVKTRLVLDAVAKAEKLEASDEEIAAVLAQIAEANKMDVKAVEKQIRKSERMGDLTAQIVRNKAAEFIVENAVETAPEDKSGAGKPAASKKPSGAGPAKKPAAKKPVATKATGTKAAAEAPDKESPADKADDK